MRSALHVPLVSFRIYLGRLPVLIAAWEHSQLKVRKFVSHVRLGTAMIRKELQVVCPVTWAASPTKVDQRLAEAVSPTHTCVVWVPLYAWHAILVSTKKRYEKQNAADV